nr:hypothetical protein [Luteimonas sp. XNQY3]
MRTPLASLHGYLETLGLKDAQLDAASVATIWTLHCRKAATSRA